MDIADFPRYCTADAFTCGDGVVNSSFGRNDTLANHMPNGCCVVRVTLGPGVPEPMRIEDGLGGLPEDARRQGQSQASDVPLIHVYSLPYSDDGDGEHGGVLRDGVAVRDQQRRKRAAALAKPRLTRQNGIRGTMPLPGTLVLYQRRHRAGGFGRISRRVLVLAAARARARSKRGDVRGPLPGQQYHKSPRLSPRGTPRGAGRARTPWIAPSDTPRAFRSWGDRGSRAPGDFFQFRSPSETPRIRDMDERSEYGGVAPSDMTSVYGGRRERAKEGRMGRGRMEAVPETPRTARSTSPLQMHLQGTAAGVGGQRGREADTASVYGGFSDAGSVFGSKDVSIQKKKFLAKAREGETPRSVLAPESPYGYQSDAGSVFGGKGKAQLRDYSTPKAPRAAPDMRIYNTPFTPSTVAGGSKGWGAPVAYQTEGFTTPKMARTPTSAWTPNTARPPGTARRPGTPAGGSSGMGMGSELTQKKEAFLAKARAQSRTPVLGPAAVHPYPKQAPKSSPLRPRQDMSSLYNDIANAYAGTALAKGTFTAPSSAKAAFSSGGTQGPFGGARMGVPKSPKAVVGERAGFSSLYDAASEMTSVYGGRTGGGPAVKSGALVSKARGDRHGSAAVPATPAAAGRRPGDKLELESAYGGGESEAGSALFGGQGMSTQKAAFLAKARRDASRSPLRGAVAEGRGPQSTYGGASDSAPLYGPSGSMSREKAAFLAKARAGDGPIPSTGQPTFTPKMRSTYSSSPYRDMDSESMMSGYSAMARGRAPAKGRPSGPLGPPAVTSHLTTYTARQAGVGGAFHDDSRSDVESMLGRRQGQPGSAKSMTPADSLVGMMLSVDQKGAKKGSITLRENSPLKERPVAASQRLNFGSGARSWDRGSMMSAQSSSHGGSGFHPPTLRRVREEDEASEMSCMYTPSVAGGGPRSTAFVSQHAHGSADMVMSWGDAFVPHVSGSRSPSPLDRGAQGYVSPQVVHVLEDRPRAPIPKFGEWKVSSKTGLMRTFSGKFEGLREDRQATVSTGGPGTGTGVGA